MTDILIFIVGYVLKQVWCLVAEFKTTQNKRYLVRCSDKNYF